MVVVRSLTVHWHQDNAPIYSASFQPKENHGIASPPNRTKRFATAGGDNNVRLWRLRLPAASDETPGVEYLATLSKHERAVNAVAFDSSGRVLASAGDDGVVCLWTENEGSEGPATAFGADFEDLESWRLLRKCRSASFGEIYDLAWSPSGRYLAATSMDKVVSILDTTDGSCVAALRDHKHYIQGVSWDPKGEYLATQSSDQRVIIYALKEDPNGGLNISNPIARLDKSEIEGQKILSFHPESFSSFFRRLSFSPDGSLLVAPAGQVDDAPAGHSQALAPGGPAPAGPTMPQALSHSSVSDPEVREQQAPANTLNAPRTAESGQAVPGIEGLGVSPAGVTSQDAASPTALGQDSGPDSTSSSLPLSQGAAGAGKIAHSSQNCAVVFARGDMQRPAALLPLPKQSLAVRFCPILFELKTSSPAVTLPYRMVYAVATLNGVFIYDTEQPQPLGMASNLHYSSLTDLTWSPDGRILMMTSIDGFCSVVRFDARELGRPYEAPATEPKLVADADTSSPALAANDAAKQPTPVVNTLVARKKKATEEPQLPSTNEGNACDTNASETFDASKAAATPASTVHMQQPLRAVNTLLARKKNGSEDCVQSTTQPAASADSAPVAGP